MTQHAPALVGAFCTLYGSRRFVIKIPGGNEDNHRNSRDGVRDSDHLRGITARRRVPARYLLYGVDETVAAIGKTVKSAYRIDTVSGKTWRIESKPFFTGSHDAQNKPMTSWADGWEEMAESPDAAVAKQQAEFRAAMDSWKTLRAVESTPSPTP